MHYYIVKKKYRRHFVLCIHILQFILHVLIWIGIVYLDDVIKSDVKSKSSQFTAC